MDHKTFIAALSDADRKRLTETADLPGLIHLAAYVFSLALTGWIIAGRGDPWAFLLIPHGVLLVFLFSLMHECIHRTAFARRWLNDGIAILCGHILFISPEWFRYFHFAHHRHTQDPEADPELSAPKPRTRWEYLVHISGIPHWRATFATLLRLIRGPATESFMPERARHRACREARAMAVVYAGLLVWSVATGTWVLFWVWLLPLALGQPFLRLYLLAEHGRCPAVADMFANSRTTFTGWLIRKLAWNMPYHAEHHAYPTVPFHRLPDLHRLTKPHLRETERGYLRFHRRYWAWLTR